jgi:hypothetical protein
LVRSEPDLTGAARQFATELVGTRSNASPTPPDGKSVLEVERISTNDFTDLFQLLKELTTKKTSL